MYWFFLTFFWEKHNFFLKVFVPKNTSLGENCCSDKERFSKILILILLSNFQRYYQRLRTIKLRIIKDRNKKHKNFSKLNGKTEFTDLPNFTMKLITLQCVKKGLIVELHSLSFILCLLHGIPANIYLFKVSKKRVE